LNQNKNLVEAANQKLKMVWW